MDLRKIGKKIREIRQKEGLTQEKFSEILDITPRYYQSIDLGEMYPSLRLLLKISKLYNVSLEELLTDAS